MKHSLLGGLTVAVTLSVFGASLPSYAQNASPGRPSQDAKAEPWQIDPVFSESELSELLEENLSGSALLDDSGRVLFPDPKLTANPTAYSESSLPVQSASPPSLESSVQASPVLENPAPEFDLVTVLPHALDTRQAATIYIRSIPVITLIGGELATLGGSKSVQSQSPLSALESDPVVRAHEIVARLVELSQTLEATAIAARWNAQQQTYVVSWGNEDLVAISSHTILPDTTRNPAEDTLQMANRLRRLLGNAPALARVEGLPQAPAPASNQLGIVTSTLIGVASWYGPGFHGRRSASGEVFNQHDLTAAHRTLPFGTRVRVTNLSTGQQVVVRVNDRGPFSRDRVIDLSAAAAASIGLRARGIGRVQLEVLSSP